MDSVLALLVAATMGVNFGWEPVDEDPGGYEYIVQLEPELLDVLRSGESVPIESYVPADVSPVRKVRIVVGRGDMARGPVTAASDANDTVVRGQNATAPQEVTVRRTESDAWSSDRSGNATAPPWPADTSSTTAPPWPQSTSDTSSASTTSGRLAQRETPRQPSTSWTSIGPSVVPPPLLTPPIQKPASSATAASSSSRNRSELLQAQPIEDRYETSPDHNGDRAEPSASDWGRAAAATEDRARTNSGPSLTDPAPSSRGLQEGLSNNDATTAQNARASSDWASSWDTAAKNTPATIRRDAGESIVDREAPDSDLVPVPPFPATDRRQTQAQATDRYADPRPVDNGQAAQPRVESPPAADWSWPAANSAERPDSRTAASAPASNIARPSDSSPSPPVVQTPPTLPPVVDNRQPVAETTRQPVQPGASSVRSEASQLAARSSAPDPQPWLPLILVSLGLAGSLGANLFLGWSYMDARQRYQSLVRKTTDSFRRVGAAAA